MLDQVNESRIDFPSSEGLCPDLWEKSGDGRWKLKPSVRRRLLDEIARIERRMRVKVTNVRIIGSICTNLYSEASDVDVHMSVDRKFADDDAAYAFNSKLWEHYYDNEMKVRKHPVQFFVQHNYFRDLSSVGVYSVTRDKWVFGPTIYPSSYDPFEELKNAMPAVERMVSDFSKNWGRLEASLRNYLICCRAEGDGFSNKSMLKRNKAKFSKDVAEACSELIALKEAVQTQRRAASADIGGFRDAKKFRNSKAWHKADAVAKFMDRYGYMEKCSDVKDIVGDSVRISPSTIYDLAGLVGIDV